MRFDENFREVFFLHYLQVQSFVLSRLNSNTKNLKGTKTRGKRGINIKDNTLETSSIVPVEDLIATLEEEDCEPNASKTEEFHSISLSLAEVEEENEVLNKNKANDEKNNENKKINDTKILEMLKKGSKRSE